MDGFKKVGTKREFREGRGRRLTVDGREITVFGRAGRFHAFGDRCPHMGASLSEGTIEGDRVRCAWHGWSFDLETGRSDRKRWAVIPVYPVRVEGEDVLVDLSEPAPAETAAEDDEAWFEWDPERTEETS